MNTGTIIDSSTKLTHRNDAGEIDYTYRLIYVADPNGTNFLDIDGQFVRCVTHVLIADRF